MKVSRISGTRKAPSGASSRISLKPSPVAWAAAMAFAGVTLLPSLMPAAHALPTGAAVVGGAATVSQSGGTMVIQQTTQRAALNWQSFGIAVGESVRFVQPSSTSVALNRVVGSDPSLILGNLSANGQVFLLNPSGVVFGSAARVDVGGLVASTLGMSTADFMAGVHTLSGGAGAGTVSNAGELTGGYIALVAPQVSNSGLITAPGGTAALVAGDRVTLDLRGDQLIGLSVDSAALQANVTHSGSVLAQGGQVYLSARSADAVLPTVINSSGLLVASSMSQRGGRIVLDGGEQGTVAVSGTLEARSEPGGSVPHTGGDITVLGQHIHLEGAKLDASGAGGGGTILVGGNWQGQGAERHASSVTADESVWLAADALTQGQGGTTVVWSVGETLFAGLVSARGKGAGGHGGQVEVSGQRLRYSGFTDTRAEQGRNGLLLLDPDDVVIATSGGTLTPTTIQNNLLGGNVIVQTANPAGTGGTGLGSITVGNAITWSSANSLTLQASQGANRPDNSGQTGAAGGSITVNAAIQATGAGALSLLAGAGGLGSMDNTGARASGAGGSVTLNAAVSTQSGALTVTAGSGGDGRPGTNVPGTSFPRGGGSGGAGGSVTVNAAVTSVSGAIAIEAGAGGDGGSSGGSLPGAVGAGGAVTVTSSGSVSGGSGAVSLRSGVGGAGSTGFGGATTTTAGTIPLSQSARAGGNIVLDGAVTTQTGAITVATQRNLLSTEQPQTITGSQIRIEVLDPGQTASSNLRVAGLVQPNAGSSVTLRASSGGQLIMELPGNFPQTSLTTTGAGTITLRGSSVAYSSVGAGMPETLTTAGGDITIDSGRTASLSLGGTGPATLDAGTGNLHLRGASVQLGGNGGVVNLRASGISAVTSGPVLIDGSATSVVWNPNGAFGTFAAQTGTGTGSVTVAMGAGGKGLTVGTVGGVTGITTRDVFLTGGSGNLSNANGGDVNINAPVSGTRVVFNGGAGSVLGRGGHVVVNAAVTSTAAESIFTGGAGGSGGFQTAGGVFASGMQGGNVTVGAGGSVTASGGLTVTGGAGGQGASTAFNLDGTTGNGGDGGRVLIQGNVSSTAPGVRLTGGAGGAAGNQSCCTANFTSGNGGQGGDVHLQASVSSVGLLVRLQGGAGGGVGTDLSTSNALPGGTPGARGAVSQTSSGRVVADTLQAYGSSVDLGHAQNLIDSGGVVGEASTGSFTLTSGSNQLAVGNINISPTDFSGITAATGITLRALGTTPGGAGFRFINPFSPPGFTPINYTGTTPGNVVIEAPRVTLAAENLNLGPNGRLIVYTYSPSGTNAIGTGIPATELSGSFTSAPPASITTPGNVLLISAAPPPPPPPPPPAPAPSPAPSPSATPSGNPAAQTNFGSNAGSVPDGFSAGAGGPASDGDDSLIDVTALTP